MGTLSRGFVLLLPLLVVDAVLDLSFFGGLQPLVVPCCMVVYSNTARGLFNIGCPFCFVTYKYPLLWGVIATYAIALGLLVWTFSFRRATRTIDGKSGEAVPLLSKALEISTLLAITGTILLAVQIWFGSFSSV